MEDPSTEQQHRAQGHSAYHGRGLEAPRSARKRPTAPKRPQSLAGARRPLGLFPPYSTTVALTITTGSIGTSCMPPLKPVDTAPIASTTSIPSTTVPNTA